MVVPCVCVGKRHEGARPRQCEISDSGRAYSRCSHHPPHVSLQHLIGGCQRSMWPVPHSESQLVNSTHTKSRPRQDSASPRPNPLDRTSTLSYPDHLARNPPLNTRASLTHQRSPGRRPPPPPAARRVVHPARLSPARVGTRLELPQPHLASRHLRPRRVPASTPSADSDSADAPALLRGDL